ncbi:hypothetical protein CAPTEDRAFT_45276, partial [Capitella teleta]
LLISGAGVPGNVLTIIAYIKHAKLWNPTNLLILSQTIGDLLTCLTGPLYFVFNYSEAGMVVTSSYKYLCLMSLGSLMISIQSSITNILALSTERFIAVYFPYRYYSLVTDAKVKMGVGMIWTVVLVINLLPFLGLETWTPEQPCMATRVYYPLYTQAIILLPSAVCLLIAALENILIGAMTVKKQHSVVPNDNINQPIQEAASKSDFKVTKMLLQVVGIFFLSWVPIMTTNVVLLNAPMKWKLNGIPEWYVALNEWTKPLMLLNAIANPFIYAFKNIDYRTAYFKLL